MRFRVLGFAFERVGKRIRGYGLVGVEDDFVHGFASGLFFVCLTNRKTFEVDPFEETLSLASGSQSLSQSLISTADSSLDQIAAGLNDGEKFDCLRFAMQLVYLSLEFYCNL